MDIIVSIKQVPETGDVKMDEETGTIVREGAESIINPLDLYAIETAIQLKEEYGGSITAVTMGPPAAEKALREAVAMGCDEGVLASGKEFAGSDTWATSRALSATIAEIGDYDLIFAGERATDGDTGQVGPGIASFLDLTLATYVSDVKDVDDNGIVVDRLLEDGYETLKLPFPAVLTVVKEISFPRLPTLRGKQKAKRIDIPNYGAEKIGIDADELGLDGSPTQVVNIDHPKVTRDGHIIEPETAEEIDDAIKELGDYLQDNELI